MKVLVVDDSALARKTLRNALKALGIEQIIEAKDGLEALQEALTNPYDLILMDWNMPRMDGIEAVDKIREMKLSVPIIMVTGLGDEYHVREAIAKGVNNFLLKPFKMEKAMTVIQDTLGIKV